MKRNTPKPKPAPKTLTPPAAAVSVKHEVQGGSVAADAENYEADEQSDANFIKAPRKFKGQRLANYSTGVRLLWLNLMSEGDSSQMLGASMVWLLIQLEIYRELAAKSTDDAEAIWEAAHVSLLVLCDNRIATRAKVVLWASKLKKAELDSTVVLSNEILDEAKREEVEPEPAAPALPTSPIDSLTTGVGN